MYLGFTMPKSPSIPGKDYPESGEDIEVLVFQPSKRNPSNPKQIRFSWPVVGKGGELGQHTVRNAVINIPDSMNEERRGMCHFTLNGEMYIVGGGYSSSSDNIPYRFRNYRIGKTEIEQLSDLTFEMQSGRCINYDGESVLFTASWNKERISEIHPDPDGFSPWIPGQDPRKP